ncbi:MAG TPA: CPBP family intramembrane glutamic endopeptidase [Chitinophagaceae bacterium]|nr:CPBP family intramembrane glutamic endopeptidase [Chitinophagaceae bacterium]
MVTGDNNSGNFSYFAQFGIFIGLIGAGLIVGTIVSVLIWMMMTGRPVLTMQDDMFKPQYYYEAITLQAVSTLFYFFLPVIVFSAICYRKPSRFLGFNTRISGKQVLIVIGILVLTFPLSGALAELNKIVPLPAPLAAKFKGWEDSREAQEAALISINSFSRYIISMLLVGLLPGLFEETVFRGGLQNILTRWFKGPVIAIVLTSILFSLVHGSYYGFLVRFALGAILGLLFYFSGNLWLPALFHFLYNGLQVTVLYATHESISAGKPQKDIESDFPIWAGLIALIAIIYLFMRFKEISSVQKAKLAEEEAGDIDFDFSRWPTKS